jgi:hypothetical protein
MFQPLDGPSKQSIISVGTGAVVEAKANSTVLTDRQVITIQPSGKLYVYFSDDGTTPSISTVSTNGFVHYKNAKETYEVGDRQKIFLLSVSGTINVIIAERA